MEGSGSVREAFSGPLVPSAVTMTVALRPPEDKEKGKFKRKILDEEEYIEVRRNKMGVKSLFRCAKCKQLL